jgi:hypothetical protein
MGSRDHPPALAWLSASTAGLNRMTETGRPVVVSVWRERKVRACTAVSPPGPDPEPHHLLPQAIRLDAVVLAAHGGELATGDRAVQAVEHAAGLHPRHVVRVAAAPVQAADARGEGLGGHLRAQVCKQDVLEARGHHRVPTAVVSHAHVVSIRASSGVMALRPTCDTNVDPSITAELAGADNRQAPSCVTHGQFPSDASVFNVIKNAILAGGGTTTATTPTSGQPPYTEKTTGTAVDRYVAKRVDTNAYVTLGSRYGYTTPFPPYSCTNGWTDKADRTAI